MSECVRPVLISSLDKSTENYWIDSTQTTVVMRTHTKESFAPPSKKAVILNSTTKNIQQTIVFPELLYVYEIKP